MSKSSSASASARLHGNDPVSVFLAAGVRMITGEPSILERALYDQRSLVRMLGVPGRTTAIRTRRI